MCGHILTPPQGPSCASLPYAFCWALPVSYAVMWSSEKRTFAEVPSYLTSEIPDHFREFS